MAFLLLALLVNMALLRDHTIQGLEDKCFSAAICYKGDKHLTEWHDISTRPQCSQSSPAADNIIQIGRRLNRTVDRFFENLAKDCQACSSFRHAIAGDSYTDGERCFAPVVCQVDGMSKTDFIQIRPFPLCAENKKENDYIYLQREKLFNATRDNVATELQKHLLEICNPCLSRKIQQATKQIAEYDWKIYTGPKQCFAPVVCSARDGSHENWLKYPDCEYSPATLLSEEPENVLSSILQMAFPDIRKLIVEECNKNICNEEPTAPGTTAMTRQSTAAPPQSTIMNHRSSATTSPTTAKDAFEDNHQTTNAIQHATPTTRPETTPILLEKATTVPETAQSTPALPRTTAVTSHATVRYSQWFRASNNLYYKYFSETVNYQTAKSRCAGHGGRLASAGFRTTDLRKEIKPLLSANAWIGLDDLASQGNYVWSDGVASTRANSEWGGGEPTDPYERCCALYKPWGYQLFDINCGVAYAYICEAGY